MNLNAKQHIAIGKLMELMQDFDHNIEVGWSEEEGTIYEPELNLILDQLSLESNLFSQWFHIRKDKR